MENQYAENIIDKLSKIMEKTVHLEEIIHLMNDLDIAKYEYQEKEILKWP